MKERIVEFKPPQGVVPEGTGVGDDFDLVSTYRVKAGGTVCLVQMGDTKLPGYEAKEKGVGSKPSYHDEAAEMVKSREGY